MGKDKTSDKSSEANHIWKMVSHIDMIDRAISIFRCELCGEEVETTYYRDDVDMLLMSDEVL